MELGNILLIIAIGAHLISGFLALRGWGQGQSRRIWYTLLAATATLTTLGAAIILIQAQINHDFSYLYVYEHTAQDLKIPYTISALWAGQAGSFLVWAVFGAGVSWLLLNAEKHGLSAEVKAALPWLAGINSVITLLALINRPFAKMIDVMVNGQGLASALHNPWMVIHPPLIFFSYAAAAVVFSLAAGGRQLPVTKLRFWSMVAWMLLTAGIMTGSRWAYLALGWGGFWAWDPLENAALVPWLLFAALGHARHNARADYMYPFLIAILGTYLTRSGLLQDRSLHAYTGIGSDFLMPLMLLMILISVVLISIHYREHFWFGSDLKVGGNRFAVLSRIFASLLLVTILAPLVSNFTPNPSSYNKAAILFVCILSGLWLIRQPWTGLYRSLPITTLLISLIAVIFTCRQIEWLLLLGGILLPMVNSIANLKLSKLPWSRALAHTGVLLLVAGAIGALTLEEQGLLFPNLNGSYTIYGHTYNGSVISEMKIVPGILRDILLTAPGGGGADQKLWYYVTRPLINLYWLGGLLLTTAIGGLAFRPSSERRENPNLNEDPMPVNEKVPQTFTAHTQDFSQTENQVGGEW